MTQTTSMVGRRVATVGDIELPGDYCLSVPPAWPDDGKRRVWFLLPNARDGDAPASARGVLHCAEPPHKFRECDDGSVEVRESISNNPHATRWHGYLDEGHRWRFVGET